MSTEKLVQNSILTVLARGLMIFSPIILGWMISRATTSIDELARTVADGNVKVQLLQQEVKLGFDANKADLASVRTTLADHEARIRAMERTRP